MILLFTSTAYPPSVGGAQTHLHHIAKQFALNHSVQVVSQWDTNRSDWLLGTTVRAPSMDKDYLWEGVPVHRIGLSVSAKLHMLPWVPAYYLLMDLCLPPLASILQREIAPYSRKADLIHNIRIGREGLSFASLREARKRDIPFILTPVHHPRWEGWRYRAYLNLYREADAVIALTVAERQNHIRLGVKEDRVFVTGIGAVLAEEANAARFREFHNIHGPCILFLGQHYAYKGYQQVLQATELVWKKFPEAKFVFIGPKVGNSENFFAPFRREGRVIHLGMVDLQTKTDALAACDLLCLPSTQESFGGVYTEAWSFGKPVIGCKVPAVAEVIEDGVNGFLVNQEVNEVADRILLLLKDLKLAESLGKNGKRKVAERYSWERITSLTEGVYQKVLNG